MSTAIVVGLILLGVGIVINQLLRLKKWLKDAPPARPRASGELTRRNRRPGSLPASPANFLVNYSGYFLKASFTFSPASFRSDLA